MASKLLIALFRQAKPVIATARADRQDTALTAFLLNLFFALALVGGARAEQTNLPPKFLGESTCASSSCHGGAGEKHNQCIIWSTFDFHTRSYATLTGARSARIADTLKVGDPTKSARCTICHAPYQTVPAAQLSEAVEWTKGVSCENCHGPAENWIRSHTRPDWTHEDRTRAGMRDVNDLYVRANTCVACHQNVDTDILAAGHPELIFELDGQSVTEPKHWREATNWSGAQTWAVGQAVALREICWQLIRERPSDKGPVGYAGVGYNIRPTTKSLDQQWAALTWLLAMPGLPGVELGRIIKIGLTNEPDMQPWDARVATALYSARHTQEWADNAAKALASASWTTENTRECLNTLAGTAAAFRAKSLPQPLQGRRAERLALALDRLVLGLNDKETARHLDPQLNKLFADAQSLPDFDPEKFAGDLEEFQKALASIK